MSPWGQTVEPHDARRLRGSAAGAAARPTAARPSTSTSSTRAWREVPPAAMGAHPPRPRSRTGPSGRRPSARNVQWCARRPRHTVAPPAARRADAVAAPGRRAGRRGVGVRQADLPAPRPVRARVSPSQLPAPRTQPVRGGPDNGRMHLMPLVSESLHLSGPRAAPRATRPSPRRRCSARPAAWRSIRSAASARAARCLGTMIRASWYSPASAARRCLRVPLPFTTAQRRASSTAKRSRARSSA